MATNPGVSRPCRTTTQSRIRTGGNSVSTENIIIVVVIVLIVLFVLGYFGRGRFRR
jgi:hypothetical protein